jgi:ABC-type amino acid transport substrate-binding protein
MPPVAGAITMAKIAFSKFAVPKFAVPKFAVLALAILLSGRAGIAWAGEPLRVAMIKDSPPLSFQAGDGTVSGFNVDLAEEICRRLELACTLTPLSFTAILDEVSAGRQDVGFGNLLWTAEREKRVRFSVPIWRSRSSFVGQDGVAFVDATPESLVKGRRVALIRGSMQHRYIVERFPDVARVEVSSVLACFEALRDGQADLTLQAMVMALPFLSRPEWGNPNYVGRELPAATLGGPVHIALAPQRPDLKIRVDAAIAEILADGTYKKISRKYFPFDIY